MGEDYSNLQQAMQQHMQSQTPLKPTGPKSNLGCIMLLIGIFVCFVAGLVAYFLVSSENVSGSKKSPDKKILTENKSSVKNTLIGNFIDAVMIPRENGKINLWILTNEPEDSKYLIHRYIYDPEEEKILNSFQNKLNNYPPNIKLFYIDKEVLEVNGGATGIEPSIVTYNQENGNVIMNTENYISQFPDLQSGISKLYVREDPLRLDVGTKDGLNITIDPINKISYRNYSEYTGSFKNNNQKVDIFALGYGNSGEDARKNLFLVTGTKANLWDKNIPESYFSDKSTLRFMKKSEAKILLKDNIFLEGVLLYQDDDCCIIFHQTQVGKNADRLLSCVDKDGKMLWTVSTENVLFPKLKATDKDAVSEMFFVKNSVSVSREGNMILFKYERVGLMVFDYNTGKKIYEIKP